MTAVQRPSGGVLAAIVPCPPGWYARWQFGVERTVSYPVIVWALARNADDQAKVVGVDAAGLWPGGDEEQPGGSFVRYVFQAVESGAPDDVFNPVQSPTERG